jgi:4-hydroxy-tetrahydrodipicolinate synthase
MGEGEGKRFRGVFAIPCTPFTEDGALDEASLRREVEFCLACGVHGLVAPVNASEFFSLTEEERRRVAEIVVGEVRGQVPVVVGVSGASTEIAVGLARHAREIGADALIAMPPYVRKCAPSEIFDFYTALGGVGLPIFLQDYNPPLGTPMPVELMVRMLREIETVRYVKEETVAAGQVMTRLMAAAGDALEGVMGGMAGRYLLNEFARGACGTMPACEMADVHVALWERLEAGDEAGARCLFNQMLPLLNYEAMFGVGVYKEVLRRRGILRTAHQRAGAVAVPDDYDRRELDRILEEMGPLFRVAPPGSLRR